MSYSNQMIDAIQNEELTQANELLEKAIVHDDKEQLYALVETLFDLGFLEETKRVVRHLLDEDNEDGLRLTLAEIAIEEGKELEAFEWIEQVSETSPYYPQALLVSADYYQVLDLPEVAKEKLLEAKDILPDEPVIVFGLGELEFASGKYKEAIGYYETLIVKNHTEFAGISLYGRLGSAYGATGDLDSAEDYLKEAVEVQESTDHLFQLGYIYYQKEEYERANELFSKVKDLDPSYSSVYVYLAKGYLEQYDENQAVETVEEGLYYDKYNEALYSIGAEAAIAQGDEEKAESYYKESVSINPENIENALHLANLMIEQERFEEALALMEPRIEAGEEDPQLFWNSAIAYNEMEEFAKARDNYEKSYPYLKENTTFLKEFIVFVREDGERERFMKEAKYYLTLDPNDEEVSEWLRNEEMY